MRTVGFVLLGLGVALPVGVAILSRIDRIREDRKHGGPPMEDAFGPIADAIDTGLLILLGLVLVVPGLILVLLG